MSLPEMTSKNGETEILSVTEVARSLRCSKAHVYNAINGKVSGVSQLPAIPMGRRKLVQRASLEAWKRANESGAVRESEVFNSVPQQAVDGIRSTEEPNSY
jgi:excisionase family DNA binding protein